MFSLFCTKGKKTDTESQKKLYKFTRNQEKNKNFPVRDHGKHKILPINEQIQNIAQKKDTLCRRMYN